MNYYGEWQSKVDVLKDFQINDIPGVVIYAVYNLDGYEGSAVVIFADQGKFWLVEGSHCSCYGLENQFDPSEMPLEGFRKILKGTMIGADHSAKLIDTLERVWEMDLEHASPDTAQVVIRLAFA